MAQSKNNVITHGLSGMIGDMLVFRQKNGKTIVAKKPKESTSAATAAQKEIRQKFQQAIIYGKSVNADPATREAYAAAAKNGQTAFNVAVADFFNAPEIDEVDVSGYFGKVGDIIKIRVTDDFAVKGVHVKIENGDNSLVENGNAVPDGNGLDWLYTATVKNTTLAGDKITITASDTPDNESLSTLMLT